MQSYRAIRALDPITENDSGHRQRTAGRNKNLYFTLGPTVYPKSAKKTSNFLRRRELEASHIFDSRSESDWTLVKAEESGIVDQYNVYKVESGSQVRIVDRDIVDAVYFDAHSFSVGDTVTLTKEDVEVEGRGTKTVQRAVSEWVTMTVTGVDVEIESGKMVANVQWERPKNIEDLRTCTVSEDGAVSTDEVGGNATAVIDGSEVTGDFLSLVERASNASSATITLTGDVELDAVVELDGNITLDLAGKNITGAVNNMITVNGEVTIKDTGKEPGKIELTNTVKWWGNFCDQCCGGFDLEPGRRECHRLWRSVCRRIQGCRCEGSCDDL